MEVRQLIVIDLSALPKEVSYEENGRLGRLVDGFPERAFFLWLGRPGL